PAPGSSSPRARSRSTSTRPMTCSLRSRSHPRSWVSADRPDGRVTILALHGIGEISGGADLGAILGDALEATADALPLEPGDVLVVTQKIVSKAEGAVVDLRTIEPRPEA